MPVRKGTRPRRVVGHERQIIEYLRIHGSATQQEIAHGINVAPSTVSRALGHDGASRRQADPNETAEDRNTQKASRSVLETDGQGAGRKYALRGENGVLLALDLGAKHIRLMANDLRGRQINQPGEASERRFDVLTDPWTALDRAVEMIRLTMREAPSDQIAGVVVGVPVTVDGGVIRDKQLGHFDVRRGLHARLHPDTAPIDVETDAFLGAIAERDHTLAQHGDNDGASTLLYVKWSSSISAAFVLEGQLFRGSSGLAGSFPHTPIHGTHVADETSACARCGKHCLNSIASLTAIVDALPVDITGELAELGAEQRAERLIGYARAGNDEVTNRLRAATQALGAALAPIVNAINPSEVVIGGAFKQADYEWLSRDLHDSLTSGLYEPVAQRLVTRQGHATGRAAAEGGLSLADELFTTEHLLALWTAASEQAAR